MITENESSDQKWGPMQLLKKLLSGKNSNIDVYRSCDKTITGHMTSVLEITELFEENKEDIIKVAARFTDENDYNCPLLISAELKMLLTQLRMIQHHIRQRSECINSTINMLIELDEKQRRNTQI